MFSAFTWGQFWTVILLLVALYYTVVALMYYREEMAGLFSRNANTPTPAKPNRPGKPGSLVKTASAFTAPKVVEEPTQQTSEQTTDEADETDEAVEMGTSPGAAPDDVVHGSLPDTHSAGLAVSETGELAPATSPADLDKRQSEPELDEVDENRKAKLRAAYADWEAEKEESLTENLNNEEPVIENSSSIVTFEEETISFVQFEEEPRYAEVVADEQQLIEVDNGIPAQLLLNFISQSQETDVATELPQLQGTTLAQELGVKQVDLNRQFTAELDDLFGNELT